MAVARRVSLFEREIRGNRNDQIAWNGHDFRMVSVGGTGTGHALTGHQIAHLVADLDHGSGETVPGDERLTFEPSSHGGPGVGEPALCTRIW